MSIALLQYASWILFAILLTQHWLPDERRQGCRLCHRQYLNYLLVRFGSQTAVELRLPEQLRGLHP